jgi:hypothetical protein
MARTRVTDKGDGFQIRKVAANVLNKQGWQIRGGPAAWELGEGLITPHRKKTVLQNVTEGLEIVGLL